MQNIIYKPKSSGIQTAKIYALTHNSSEVLDIIVEVEPPKTPSRNKPPRFTSRVNKFEEDLSEDFFFNKNYQQGLQQVPYMIKYQIQIPPIEDDIN